METFIFLILKKEDEIHSDGEFVVGAFSNRSSAEKRVEWLEESDTADEGPLYCYRIMEIRLED